MTTLYLAHVFARLDDYSPVVTPMVGVFSSHDLALAAAEQRGSPAR